MQKFLPLLFILLLYTCGRAPKEVRVGKASILPQPLELQTGEGHFTFSDGLTIGVESTGQEQLLEAFLTDFARASGWRPAVVIGGSRAFQLRTDANIAPEGYQLSVSPEEIVISAASEAGFFYGLQSLRQLFPPAFVVADSNTNVDWAIPAVNIKDEPAFGWRGYMLDVSRHFFTVEQVKEVLDLIASQKFNRFHWHLTDDQGWRIQINSYPKLTEIGAWRADRTNTDERYSDWWGRAPLQSGEEPSYGGFYTQEDIREIVAYAKARHIEVVPEIDMPGHAQAALASYPEIGCVDALPNVATGGVFKNNTLNPGKDVTYAFAEQVLNEVMDLFPFNYVHIGGDECNKSQWKKDPDAQRKMQEEGLATEEELQSYFIRRLEEIINARGKTMIGWDEILEGGLAPNATVMSWRGEAGGLAAIRAGHEVIMTPSKYCYLDLKQGHDDLEPNLGYSRVLLSTAYNYQVIPDSLSNEQASLIKGIQANMWTESISDWSKFTYMNFPRLYAVAENAWSAESRKDWDSFVDRIVHQQQRLDTLGVRYAVSAFSPWVHHERQGDSILVRLEVEANGLEIHYTLDGSAPSPEAKLYQEPFTLQAGDQLHTQAFRKGKAVGYPVALDLPVHLAANVEVSQQKKTLAKLTDLQYARLTTADTNWQALPYEATLQLDFEEPTTVSSLRFSALRYTISGVYPPQVFEVFASTTASNGQLVSLGKV
ncbi:MAG: family 20 glycosylhydrolase, partial [Bacteroidota bacterium]